MPDTRDTGAAGKDSRESHAKGELIASVGAVSDKGIRTENQDRMSRAEVALGELLIVADGVGGNAGGATAASLTIDTIEEYLRKADVDANPQTALHLAIERANKAVYGPAHAGDPSVQDMVSTVVAVLIRNGTAYLAHAGDSRAYLLRDGKLTHLTKDHTRIQQMMDAGQLTAQQAAQHPDSGIITRAVGNKPEIDVEDGTPLPLRDGDSLLLCSDGLHGSVNDNEILATIKRAASPQEAAQELVELASKNGSRDNITVQYVRFRPAVAGTEPGGKKENNVRKPGVSWAAAAAMAVAVGAAGFLGYPLIHPAAPPDPGPAAGAIQDYTGAVAEVSAQQAEYDRYRTAQDGAQKSLGDLQQAVFAAETLAQMKKTRDALQATRDALTAQAGAVDATVEALASKTKKNDAENRSLQSAKTAKAELAAKVASATQSVTDADQQVATRQTELDRARQTLKLQPGASDSDLSRELVKAKAAQAQADGDAQGALRKLEAARSLLALRTDGLKRTGIRVSPPVQGASAPAKAGVTVFRIVILPSKPGDTVAAGLRDYFTANPVEGARFEAAQVEKSDATGSATVFSSELKPDSNEAHALRDLSTKVEAGLRAYIAQNKKSASRLSIVITPAGN